jgi:hypothetical protein
MEHPEIEFSQPSENLYRYEDTGGSGFIELEFPAGDPLHPQSIKLLSDDDNSIVGEWIRYFSSEFGAMFLDAEGGALPR